MRNINCMFLLLWKWKHKQIKTCKHILVLSTWRYLYINLSMTCNNLMFDMKSDAFFLLKVAYVQKVRSIFKISRSPKKKYSKKNILNLKFEIPTHNSIMLWGGNFEFQVQDSILEYFFWRFGDFKTQSHFLKKATFT